MWAEIDAGTVRAAGRSGMGRLLLAELILPLRGLVGRLILAVVLVGHARNLLFGNAVRGMAPIQGHTPEDASGTRGPRHSATGPHITCRMEMSHVQTV